MLITRRHNVEWGLEDFQLVLVRFQASTRLCTHSCRLSGEEDGPCNKDKRSAASALEPALQKPADVTNQVWQAVYEQVYLISVYLALAMWPSTSSA